jgi:hypothetical protein
MFSMTAGRAGIELAFGGTAGTPGMRVTAGTPGMRVTAGTPGLTERAGPENVAKQIAAPQATKNAEKILFFMMHTHQSAIEESLT